MNKVKNNNKHTVIAFIGAIALLLLPIATFAQTANTAGTGEQSGIASCAGYGGSSIGATSATGGVYVPVADATVELNTGILVYKECVLRVTVDAQKQAATAGIYGRAYNQILTGRNGAPQFMVNQGQDLIQYVTDPIVLAALQNGTLQTVDPTLLPVVQQSIAQGYSIVTRSPASQLACPYQGAVSDFTNPNSQGSILTDILAVGSMCNPFFAYTDANSMVMDSVSQGEQYQLNQWMWGGGYYSVTTGGNNPLTQQIVTPSSLVNSSFTQIVQSPFNQLQSANDIGQMVNALFSGLSTQIISPSGGGLAGLAQSASGQASYLSQAIGQTTQNLQNNLTNNALNALQTALQIEQNYFNTMSSIAGTLSGSISQLRSAESQCFQQVITHVCTTGPSAGSNSCTGANGSTLTIATSTAFSQAVIGSQIASLASTTANNLVISQESLNLINQLIQQVSNSSSAATQNQAIQELNTLEANNELHTQSDENTAQQQQSSVQSAMATLVQNTVSLWAGTDPNNSSNTNIAWNGSISPGTGWCNFQNQTTLQLWEQQW
jgi:hypothetical protein